MGYANPAQIRSDCSARVESEIGGKLEAAHLHNTRGLGLANALAAYEEGVRHFDSSMGGLGGCPFAPGASGNVITEDLVFMFESMGVPTGIDLDKLMEARKLHGRGDSRRARVRPHGARRRAQGVPCCRLTGAARRVVVEFAHMVMGPSCGLVLADLGAEVIKVEPLEGDNTRRLQGAGAGFFPVFNRNKKSLAVDLKSPEGMELVLKLIATRRRGDRELPPGRAGQAGPGLRGALGEAIRGSSTARSRASCPGPTTTARRWTRWCR